MRRHTTQQDDIGCKVLAELHIVAEVDHRADDLWAWDDEFVKDFLLSTFANRHQKDRAWAWKRAIDLYWRGGATRRELAAELRRSLDAVKSLLKTIRASAKRFMASRATADLPQGFKTRFRIREWTPPHTIGEADILASADGDEAAGAFIEEYARLEVASRLRLFDDNISAKLGQLLDRSEALGTIDTAAIDSAIDVFALVSEAHALKLGAAKRDPFEGRALFPFDKEKRYVLPKGRGRPRKIQLDTKLMVHQEIETIKTPPISELFLVQEEKQIFCGGEECLTNVPKRFVRFTT
jgi:hypothetical protein